MKIKYRKKWIKACEKLLKHYKGEIYISCPLCPVAKYKCEKCLWHIFKKIDCIEYGYKHFGESGWKLKVLRNQKWCKCRIAMLERWIKKLEKDE